MQYELPARQLYQKVIATQNLMLSNEASIKKQETLFNNFPKEMQVKLLHRFENKTKGFIIGGLVLFALSAVLIGICLYLWSDNGKMKDNDIKFRMVRQIAPNVAYQAETLYYPNPEGMQKKTKQLEAQQLDLAEAEAAAKEAEKEAALAKKEAKSLKKSKAVLQK